MALAFFKSRGDTRRPSQKTEQKLESVRFTVHKFNNRPKPKKRDRIKIVSCFSEFGCEVLGCLYCIPRLLRRYPGQYVIAMGWHGRDYLYRHLVDEFWEIDEEFMWLRDHARAFHHLSTNLKKLEEAATTHGEVVPSAALGKYAIANMCRTCGKFGQEWKKQWEKCPACGSTVLIRSIFTDIATYKPQARPIPRPSEKMMEWAKGILKPKTVGIFARGRKTYGRNLQPDFYVKLISLLESMGYNVIWLGEKQSTQPCPVEHVLDFSRMPESRDLERTLAIISNLEFTVQFWTASTRLAGIMRVPFLLFESPEQIYVSYSGLMGAQEGKRLELCSFGPKKVVLSHYTNVYNDHEGGLKLVQRAIEEMREGNWEDILGLIEDEEFSTILQEEHYEMLT
jgi:DNA-directed RNA polymerase subunit RPC12/RpoP